MNLAHDEEGKKIVYIALSISIISAITLILIPPASLLMSLIGFVLSWRARSISVKKTPDRFIANVSLAISILIIVLFIGGALGLLVVKGKAITTVS